MTRNNNINYDCLAQEFLNANYVYAGTVGEGNHYTLRSWRNDFYKYEEGHYVEVPESDMKACVTMHLRTLNREAIPERQHNITPYLVKNVLFCLKGTEGIFVPGKAKTNTWVSSGTTGSVQTLAFKNGLLVIDQGSLSTEFVKHTPDYFTLTKLPYDYKEDAKCQKWLKFLDDIMEGDADRIQLLQQWAGYILTSNLRQHKFLLCAGEGANGKSVFFQVIERMVGTENCSHVPLAKFGESFVLSSTLGKILNSSTESSKEIGRCTEEMFKAYVAGDLMNFQRKFREPIEAKPTAKVMIATNANPRFRDKSQGIWRRMLFVPFGKTYSEDQQNKNLANELAVELPGIFNWAFEGMRMLTKEGLFIKPVKCETAIKEYKRDANPAIAFLEDNYEVSESKTVSSQEVYSAYKDWCEENGYKPMNRSNFGKEVNKVFPTVEKARLSKAEDGKRPPAYKGLAQREDAEIAQGAGELL